MDQSGSPTPATTIDKIMKKILIVTVTALTMIVNASDVKEIYTKNCAKCHGEDGKGQTTMGKKLGIKDYTNPETQSKLNDPQMVKAIKQGVKEDDKTKMKAFDVFTDEEVNGLVAYIRTFKK